MWGRTESVVLTIMPVLCSWNLKHLFLDNLIMMHHYYIAGQLDQGAWITFFENPMKNLKYILKHTIVCGVHYDYPEITINWTTEKGQYQIDYHSTHSICLLQFSYPLSTYIVEEETDVWEIIFDFHPLTNSLHRRLRWWWIYFTLCYYTTKRRNWVRSADYGGLTRCTLFYVEA